MTVGLSRRDLLRASGPAAALFPFLRTALAAPQPPALRLVLLMQSNGTTQGLFWPDPSFRSPVLAPLLDDPRLRAKTTVIRGLYNHDGGSGNGHDHGFAGLWSGYRPVGPFSDPWGNGISIDQILKQRLEFAEPFPTLNCGVLASGTPRFKQHRGSFSYTEANRQVPTQTDIYKLYARFFSPPWAPVAGLDPAAAARVRLRQQRSVLDYVNQDLRTLRPRLPAAERPKLDAHTAALRALENRLGATLSVVAERPALCTKVAGPAPGIDVLDEANVPVLMDLMMDFVAVAVTCGLTRVVTFPMGNGGEKWYFAWLGINENSHDWIAHADDGQRPDVTDKLLRMNRWYAGKVARFAAALDAVPEGSGTALDHTLVVWGNEVATGPHGMDDIPIVMVGGAGGRLGRTGRLIDHGPQDHHRLGTSVLNLMGVPAPGFGENLTCGPLQGVGT